MRTLLTGNRYFNPRSLTGATFLLSGLSIQSKFQSTLLYGSDRTQAARPAPWPLFQSMLPYGSDAGPEGAYIYHANFNPRSLTGATALGLEPIPLTPISIHAPSRERQRYPADVYDKSAFQSTLPHGSDGSHTHVLNNPCDISIHAPLRERHNPLRRLLEKLKISIHAPLRERRRGTAWLRKFRRISIHATLRE